jgi:hypothetical protein
MKHSFSEFQEILVDIYLKSLRNSNFQRTMNFYGILVSQSSLLSRIHFLFLNPVSF